jgi:L-lactate permease
MPDTPDFDGLGAFLRAIEERLPWGRRLVSGMLVMGVLAFFAFCVGVIAPVVNSIVTAATGIRPTLKPSDFISLIATAAVYLVIALWVGTRIGKVTGGLIVMGKRENEIKKLQEQNLESWRAQYEKWLELHKQMDRLHEAIDSVKTLVEDYGKKINTE